MSELSRLRWLCRRGMKELDVVMSGYLEQYYETAAPPDQEYFKTLLEMPDPELYSLLLGRSRAPEPGLQGFVRFLRGISRKD